MRSIVISRLRSVLVVLALPWQWLKNRLARLGQAVRRGSQAAQELLGRMGITLRTTLSRIGLTFKRPIHWLLSLLRRRASQLWLIAHRSLAALWQRLGICQQRVRRALRWTVATLWRPVSWIGVRLYRPLRTLALLIWGATLWIAPYLWEEIGRLGVAARHLLSVATWPLVAPARLLWRRAIGPCLAHIRDWITLWLLIIGRAARSRWTVHQARRRVREKEKLALIRNQPRLALSARRKWVRLAVTMAALNLILLVLWVRTASHNRQPEETGIALLPPSPTQSPTASPTPSPSPSPTPPPTLIAVAPAPTPDYLSAGGSVAFVVRHGGNDDIYALSISRERPARLTNDPADDRDPAWSPDGRVLSFASRRAGNWDLYLLDVASLAVTRLTRNIAFDANPSWSPDGQWLVFESYREENMDIYIMPVTGGDPIRLTMHPAADYAPTWSPSGRHIAFVSWRTGNPDIHLLSLDDARDEAAVNISRSSDIEEDHPSWHPGGDYLAFTGRSGSQQLVYVQPMLNSLPSDNPVNIGQGKEPTWAPSGHAVLYVHCAGARQFLLATSVNGWGAAPQVYLDEHPLHAPAWSAAALPPGLAIADVLVGDDPPLYLESIADPAAHAPHYTLVTLDEVQVAGPYLNDRVDDSFQALRAEVIEQAGWDFLAALDKIWEPMDAVPPPGLSAESWNKAGRAFDIARDLNSGYRPLVEVVRELDGATTWWRLYVRTRRQDGSQGEPLRTRPWSFQARYSGNIVDYESGGRVKAAIPVGYYVDFTQMAGDYDWERVPAAATWRTNFPATQFWHHEKRQGLDWDAAMWELYSAKDLQQAVEGFAP